MPAYTPTVWVDEIPASIPVKYKISQLSDGDIATDATIEVVTPLTPGTPLNAANLNKIENRLVETLTSDDLTTLLTGIMEAIYPVGCIFTSTLSSNPVGDLGFGTWIAFGAGRVLVGAGTSDATYTAGATGGESNHTLNATEMPVHTHIQNAHQHISGEDGKWFAPWVSGSSEYNLRTNGAANLGVAATATNQNAGGGGAHNNMPPYVVVYMWKRTA